MKMKTSIICAAVAASAVGSAVGPSMSASDTDVSSIVAYLKSESNLPGIWSDILRQNDQSNAEVLLVMDGGGGSRGGGWA
jgi:hypothetical protein